MKRPQQGSHRQPQQMRKAEPFSVISGMLRIALALHQTGRLSEAERIYRQILAIDAHHADSLHLLGMIEYQRGRPKLAIALIRRAIKYNLKGAAYYSNLGTVYHALGRLEEAAGWYQQAVVLQPDMVTAHFNLGSLFQTQERLDEAAACYQRALLLKPNLAEAHYNLGNLFQAQRKLDEAVQCYERALEIDPAKYEALHNLGNALQDQDKLEDARRCYERALTIEPGYAKAHYSLAALDHSQGEVGKALKGYRTALTLQPDFADAAFAEGLAHLLNGDFATGWRSYEWRWRTKEQTPPMRSYVQRLWTGEKLADGRLLIWGEQGIGDEIMFAGLIPDFLRTGNRCILDCDARLKPLFERSFPNIEVVSSRASGDDPGRNSEMHVTAHLPCANLPGLFRPDLAAFAATTSPYLVADSTEREKFRANYADGRRLVGVAWYTNNKKTGRIRSIDLAMFAPLLARRDIRWISLQYGDHDWLQNQATASDAPLLIDRRVNQFSNIDLFAAQIAAMDLVVTIDNSTAHLAGALGIPTWVLLPFASDWRWMREREDSPWYPTLRLFRQPSRGDWQSVIQRVEHEL
ncbi:MAG TPA: tetratricopeptide repeat protein [Candidatus Acidoferrales bacterium]|nr:tetratricopeptide repeat protein [Candidatus Acidoferrales bacterium]